MDWHILLKFVYSKCLIEEFCAPFTYWSVLMIPCWIWYEFSWQLPCLPCKRLLNISQIFWSILFLNIRCTGEILRRMLVQFDHSQLKWHGLYLLELQKVVTMISQFAKKFQIYNFWLLTSYCLSFEVWVCMNEKEIYLSMQSTIRMRRDW